MFTVVKDEVRRLDVSRKALRSFGLLVGGVLAAIAFVILWRSDWHAGHAVQVLAGISSVLVLAGLILPAMLKPFYLVWMALAFTLGFVMTRVLLTLVFFLVVTPIGLVMRAFGRDPLHRRIDRSTASYWIRKTYHDDTPGRLEKFY